LHAHARRSGLLAQRLTAANNAAMENREWLRRSKANF
jgi:hypothetical protein